MREFASRGGNLLRIVFASHPMIARTPPYEIDEHAFVLLDRLLDHCERYGVRVVIDPHTVPGTRRTTTTAASDQLWRDFNLHAQLIRLWTVIATRYKNRGDVIAGYDLLNEPAIPMNGARDSPADWNLLVWKLVVAIRTVDETHAIVIEPPSLVSPDGRRFSPYDGMTYLEAPPDPNVVYSPHVYEPSAFTHQSLEVPEPTIYPGMIGGTLWNAATLETLLEPVVRFQQRYRVPILIGEFSAPRWAGAAGNRYVRDVIEISERHGWSWAYHAYREADVWDAERDNDDPHDRRRYPSTPRLELLKSFFQRNQPEGPTPR